MNENEPDELGQTATTKGGQAVNIRMVGFDKPLLTAIAILLGIVVAFYAFTISQEVIRMEYWLQRNEAFLEQLSNQGVRVPPDLLHKEQKP